jgi:RNase P subunit RPR2
MKNRESKTEIRKKIDYFFGKRNFKPEDLKKIKRLAMKYKIRLGEHRKKFCKKCLAKLKGKTRVGRVFKTVECENCGYRNRFSLRKD